MQDLNGLFIRQFVLLRSRVAPGIYCGPKDKAPGIDSYLEQAARNRCNQPLKLQHNVAQISLIPHPQARGIIT